MIAIEETNVYETIALWCARANMAGYCFASPLFGAPTSQIVDMPYIDWKDMVASYFIETADDDGQDSVDQEDDKEAKDDDDGHVDDEILYKTQTNLGEATQSAESTATHMSSQFSNASLGIESNVGVSWITRRPLRILLIAIGALIVY